MKKAELLEMIKNGENSGVEFKRDSLDNKIPGSSIENLDLRRLRDYFFRIRQQDVMRDYGYLEHMGMGIPRKIIKGMLRHNGTKPELIEDGESFILRLRK